jgi:predicted phosphoribosyltransferase
VFRDRREAGQRLAAALAAVVTPPAVVAAIPRGGVAVALPIVERLQVPLTLVYARKLTSRLAPELAVGALDEDGETVIDPRAVALVGLDDAGLETAKVRVAAEIRRRMQLYGVPSLSRHLPGVSVVLVDDGLATGLTMRAALAHARRHGAREVVVAVPCAAQEAARRFRAEADRFVSLVVDPDFYAVGAYYMDFSPVSDEEVLRMLADAQTLAARRAAPAAARPLS